MIISRSVLFRMRNFSDKSCSENRNTHFVLSNFFSENRAVFEIMWEKYGRTRQATDDNIIRRMRVVCWITRATSTHSDRVTFIAFPLQQWLAECTTMLR
jgi:hypothetical protein